MSAAEREPRFWHSPLWRMRLWSVLAALALAMMEVTAATLWYQAVFHLSAPPWFFIFTVLILVDGGSSLAVRGMHALHWRIPIQRAVFLLWVLVAAFASLKLLIYPTIPLTLFDLLVAPFQFILRNDVSGKSFFHLIIILLLAWRGVSATRAPVTTFGVHASFQIGLVTLLLYGMIYAPQHALDAIIGLFLFLYCGLIAMSMARIANLSEMRGGRIPRIGAGWVASIMIAAAAVIALAIAAGWLSTGRLVELLAFGLLIIFAILTALVMIILSPLLAYLSEIIPLLADLIAKLIERFRTVPFSRQIEQLIGVINDVMEKATPYLLAGRGLFLLLIIAVIVAVLLLALYLRKKSFELMEEEESETAEPGETGNFFQKLVQRLLRDARRLRLRGPAQILAAARIRRIYRQMMLLSQKLGAERSPSTTPLEFLPVLAGIFPEEDQHLGQITAAYIKVRYGEYPETSSEVDEVQAAWESVRQRGRKALITRRKAKK